MTPQSSTARSSTGEGRSDFVSSGPLPHRDLIEGAFWQNTPLYRDVTEADFLDHSWQMRNSVYGAKRLSEILERASGHRLARDAERALERAPMSVRVTPYLLSLIDWDEPWGDPIRRQFIPLNMQLEDDHPMLTLDSLAEKEDSAAPGLTHRYRDKALFLPLDTCPVYCRFCTRSYAIGVDTESVEKDSFKINPARWEKVFEYIEATPELEDIVVSGGDAFNLPAKHVRAIGDRLLDIAHVRRIRFATKGLAVLPMKILSDEDWLDAISRVARRGRALHKEVCIHTHFNHSREITAISRRALNRLFERAITVRNQSVLQRGVNDSLEEQQLLAKRLGEVNVQPYYVYQHDMVHGVDDLRTPLSLALDLERGVRGVTAGFNTPTFVVDAPGGGGKRGVHSYEHYNPESGISVYTAPSVKPGEAFLYFDPLHALSESAREAWRDPDAREAMCSDATRAAGI